MQFIFESFRALVINLSKVSKEDVAREIDELTKYKSPRADVIKQDLYNAMLAIQFSKDAAAKKKYLAALKIYQDLTDKSKEAVYEYLITTFDHLSYSSSFR